MRKRAALLLLLASCFPDADKLRAKSSGSGPPGGSGGGVGNGGSGGSAAGMGGGAAGSGGGGGGATGNRAQLCNELALASAAKAAACTPFLQIFRYGSQPAQAARIRLNCNLYDLPSVLFPPSPFKPCADALQAEPCNDWIDGAVPPACLGPGALAEGATCTAGYQCATDLCDIPATGCGKCATLPPAGDPCYKGFCAAGLVCNPGGICAKPGRAGETCDENAPCAESLGCHGGVCGPRGAPGANCASNDECDIYHGSICGMMNTTCVNVSTGPMCTLNPDGSYVFCGGGATCQADGSCTPAAADGAACTMTDKGPDCLWPAQCLSDMKCHLFQANRSCLGTAAVRPTEPDLGPLPARLGVAAFWRSLVPRPPGPKNF
jgi:hypothetical protein